MAFFQSSWDVSRGRYYQFIKVFQEFHTFGKFEKTLSGTFMVLVPKEVRALDIKDYSTINLVNEVYKIISKVLANYFE